LKVWIEGGFRVEPPLVTSAVFAHFLRKKYGKKQPLPEKGEDIFF
jgi:hypothetical protein